MEEPQTQSVEFNVDLPKPQPTSLIAKIILAIGVLAVIGVVAAVVISRTATPAVDPTVKVMPPNTMLLLSMNTQSDQLPNFKAVGDAWAGSKEANQIKSALQLAFIQTGFNWESDVQPWLGERVTFGLIDLGGTDASQSDSGYRAPRFLLAIETRDRAKSDAFLVSVRKELQSKITPSDYMTTTIHDDTYRGIPIVYLTSETNWSGIKPTVSDVVAYAPVNDLIVVTTNADYLKQAIDAALDGNNLAVSANYQTTMNALPGQNAFAMYMDFNTYVQAAMDMALGISSQMGPALGGSAMPDPAKQLEQLQKAKETLQAMGGMGLAMTYEPTGIRFDSAVQMDLAKLPEAQRKLYEASYQAAANKIYEAVPAVTMALLNGNNPAGYLKPFFDPSQPDPFANLPGMGSESFRDKAAQLEKLAGVDLNADLIDLLNGEFAFTIAPKVQTASDNPTAKPDLPFEFALLMDSSDAARASATIDKLIQAIAAQSKGSVEWQSLSGLPYSVVMLDGNKTPVLTYGVVDGRLAVGSTSDTLLAIQNAKQAPITGDATFKTATGLLPGTRTQTGYMNLQALWTWIESQAKDGDPNVSAVLNYLGHFKWISLGNGVPSNNLIQSEVHIGVGK